MKRIQNCLIKYRMVAVMAAMAALCSVAHEASAHNYNQRWAKEHDNYRNAAILELSEEQILKLVPRYAHMVGSKSPIPGSESRSWKFDPRDPDRIREWNYFLWTKKGVADLSSLPTKGRRKLVIATIKGQPETVYVRFFDNKADVYKQYELKAASCKELLHPLEHMHYWSGSRLWDYEQETLIKGIAALTGHKVEEGEFVPNKNYPEDHKMKVKVHGGKWVEIPYYQNDKGEKFFLSCARDKLHWLWVWRQCRHLVLARTVRNEKDPLKKKAHLRKLIVFAEAYAEASPKLAIADIHYMEGNGLVPANLDDKRPWWKPDRYARDGQGLPAVILKEMVGLLHDEAPEWFNAGRPGGSDKTNGQFVARNIMVPGLEFWQGHSRIIDESGNIDIYGYNDFAQAGGLYDVTEIGYWVLDHVLKIRKRYHVSGDGCGLEGGYFNMWKEGRVSPMLEVLRNTEWSNATLREDADALLDDVHLYRFGRSVSSYSFPDGWRMGNGSCHVKQYPKGKAPYRKSYNSAMPSTMVFRMGDGEGDQQVMAVMMNTQGCNHSHDFPLNFLLYANGRPLYEDNSQYGGYLSSHNTVSVDRREHSPRKGFFDFGFFAPMMPGIAAVRMSRHLETGAVKDPGEGVRKPPVPINVKAYDRTLIHNTIDLRHTYVVDVFEVEGGKFHEYFLHGLNWDAMRSARDSLSPSLRESLDTESTMSHEDRWNKKMSGYWHMTPPFKNCASTFLHKDGYVDLRFKARPKEGIRIHLQADPKIKLWATDRPNGSVRWEYLKENDYPQLILAHRDEESPLCRTVFVVLHEPFKDKPGVESFNHKTINDGKALAIEVKMKDGREDSYLVALGRHQVRHMAHGDMKATAELAAACRKEGKSDLWLISGEEASVPGKTLKAFEPNLNGAKVLDITAREKPGQENSILTDADLPLGETLAGQFVILEFSDPVRNNKGETEQEKDVNWHRADWNSEDASALRRPCEIDHIVQEGQFRRIMLRNYTMGVCT